MPELPSGTVTFAFTDIEDSTELLKRLGDEYREVLSGHRRIVRERFAASEGIEIDRQGDAFFFVFPRARDAVAAAVEAQRAHAAASWPGDAAVRVRMGLHTGEPAVHEEGYVGLDVVRAARICSLGRGGQILLSETTRALLGAGLPEGVSVFPLGQRHLRGIEEPERVYEVAVDDLEPGPSESREPVGPSAAEEGRMPEALDPEMERRFGNLGTRLSAEIQERMLRSLEERIGPTDVSASGGDAASGVEAIVGRLGSLADEIDGLVRSALAKKGIEPDDS